MIARILYRESVHGVLNYVFGKEGGTVLGFKNTYSEFGTDTKLFANVLHYLGQRHESPQRYSHITINLPHGEHLENGTFYRLAQDYMEGMGYGGQPYVVVRHNDTLHEHIHIVSTTIKENGSRINLSHDYRRNVATQKHLERSYGLSPSPETKSHRALPRYRMPELQFAADDSNGTKFYMQDVLNGMLQRHKVRNFDQLAFLLEPYHIALRTMKNENGRVGVAYGIDNQKKYRTQFINGSTVHPKLSGPKLTTVFEKNSRSKLLPMHKKRLEKQLLTTFNLFKCIGHEDLPDVLKTYQNIDCELLYGKNNHLKDIILYDKSGYVFNASEISARIDFAQHPRLIADESGNTLIDTEGKQFVLEIKKLIRDAFYKSYLGADKKNMLLSEFVMVKNLGDLMPHVARSERFPFIGHYCERNNDKKVLKALQNEFGGTRQELNETETKKEAKTLADRGVLIRKILEDKVFDTNINNSVPFYLVQGLGLKYNGGVLSYRNSNAHSIRMPIENSGPPKTDTSYISTGCIDQNVKVLEMLADDEKNQDDNLNATSFFLPLLLPGLYQAMNDEYRKRFEIASLRAYIKTAERFHIDYEKSPVDYIELFNAKGFYIEQKEGKLHLGSIYSKHPIGIPFAPKTQACLKSIDNLDKVLEQQKKGIESITESGRGELGNLWLSYLIERKLYGKAAYVMVYEGLRPNLAAEPLEDHLGNGLRQKILEVSEQKISNRQAAILRKGIYAFSALLGGNGRTEEEMFNGFKDELTDYGKFKGRNMFI
ncbi:hypothetical protein LCGC14_1485420 [marine sediment metagenome]|uniref:MobA/VirD2-like nuclease domain-containing protein n=1 Tax=marine sediment metagenome TaxID=412755 RepID=A0A0F9J8Y4_9ZZZZ